MYLKLVGQFPMEMFWLWWRSMFTYKIVIESNFTVLLIEKGKDKYLRLS